MRANQRYVISVVTPVDSMCGSQMQIDMKIFNADVVESDGDMEGASACSLPRPSIVGQMYFKDD